MSFSVFTRTWWKRNKSWPNGREPTMGKKHFLYRNISTEEEARRICREWNNSHDPGPMSRKAEYQSN